MPRLLIVTSILLTAALSADGDEEYEKEIKPLLEHYCYGCHGEGSSKGGFSMDKFADLSGHLDDLKHWMPVWQDVRSQVLKQQKVHL